MKAPLTVLPIIHSNGTSPARLLEDYCAARMAVGNALSYLANSVEFHQRDYYLAEGSWSRAVVQHQERLDKLRQINDELTDIIDHVSNFIKD